MIQLDGFANLEEFSVIECLKTAKKTIKKANIGELYLRYLGDIVNGEINL